MANSIAVYSGFGYYRRTKKARRAGKRFASKIRKCGRKFRHQRKYPRTAAGWRRYLKKCLKRSR